MRICYVNFSLDNPRDQVTLRGLRENGVEVREIANNTPGWRKYLCIARMYRVTGKDCDCVIVGYMAGVLVPLLRCLTRKTVYYNTLCSFYDGMILSRFGGRRFSFPAAWYYLLDFVSFHLATRSFVESWSQREAIARRYRVRPDKLAVAFVGADDREFFFDPAVPKLKEFTVVFRGMFLPEAGADVVVRAAKILEHENIRIRLIGRGLLLPDVEKLVRELAPTNLEFITARQPTESLRRMILECHLSLGQLAAHPRLETTIPHKAFESMAMKLPYLTGANKGVLEVMRDEETCFTVAPGDHRALAQKILELKNRPQDLARVAGNAHHLYQQAFTPRALGRVLVNALS